MENVASGDRIAGEPSGLVVNQGFIGLLTQDASGTMGQAKATSVAPDTAAGTTAAAATPAATSTAPSRTVTEAPATGLSHLDLMKAQWSQATAEERRAFLQWISQPAP